jgi:hypothetical protein
MSSIAPEILAYLEHRAKEHGVAKNSWEGCAAILRYVSHACQRAPMLADLEAADEAGIEQLFVREVTYLAALVNELFDGEGIEELATYLSDPFPFQ